jgi:hypothetical protein
MFLNLLDLQKEQGANLAGPGGPFAANAPARPRRDGFRLIIRIREKELSLGLFPVP